MILLKGVFLNYVADAAAPLSHPQQYSIPDSCEAKKSLQNINHNFLITILMQFILFDEI